MRKLIVSLIVLALVGSASAAVVWGPTEDVVITDSVTLTGSAEVGITHDFATLTVNSGGALTASRLYQGYGAGDTVTVNAGGTLHLTAFVLVGYDYDSTFTQNGGTVESEVLYIGRTAGTYNMAGGLLLLNDDDSAPGGSGVLAMPPLGGYDYGTLNYSGGTIEINQEDWSAATGLDILSQSWFNDLSGGASVVWNGDNTTITPEPATMCLLGLGGLLIRRKR